MKINGRSIGADQPPYILAELSGNHNGDMDVALRTISMAKERGADGVKLQTYTADTLTIDVDSADFRIEGGLWDGQTLYELYKQAHTPFEWHRELFEHARNIGITLFSTPFDESAVDLLEELDTPAYKIASFEAIDLGLIAYTASKGRPMVISTGMANEQEIGQAVECARDSGCRDLLLLHCVSGYPTPADQYNLHTITMLRERFGTLVGLSDHTMGVATAIASVALGAVFIEKHVILDRKLGGPDSAFSIEPEGLERLVTETREAYSALGAPTFNRTSAEAGNLVFRRSLYVVKDVAAGEPVTRDNVRSIRPGFGMAPRLLGDYLGARFARPVKRGERFEASLLE